MSQCDAARVLKPLIAEIDGPHRRAATMALLTFKPAAAVAPLRRVLPASESSKGMRGVANLLARIGTPAAAGALAANLQRLSKLNNRRVDWGNSLGDFCVPPSCHVRAHHGRLRRVARQQATRSASGGASDSDLRKNSSSGQSERASFASRLSLLRTRLLQHRLGCHCGKGCVRDVPHSACS